jgi:hypothetical protein
VKTTLGDEGKYCGANSLLNTLKYQTFNRSTDMQSIGVRKPSQAAFLIRSSQKSVRACHPTEISRDHTNAEP